MSLWFWKYFSINVGSTLFLKRHLRFGRHQVVRQHSSASLLLGIGLDPSVSKVPIVTCMASESTQFYPLFSWPCGNTEVTLFLHNAVYCPPGLPLSRYIVCTLFCENDSVFPLFLGPTPLCAFCFFPKASLKSSVQGLSLLGRHLYPLNRNVSSNCGSPPSPPWGGASVLACWGICPCVVGQGGFAQIHEAFFQISVQVMRARLPFTALPLGFRVEERASSPLASASPLFK